MLLELFVNVMPDGEDDFLFVSLLVPQRQYVWLYEIARSDEEQLQVQNS